ncbi:hypothetical protein D3C76_1037570 [compost metagenome]
MAFEFDQAAGVAAPAGHDPGQCSQQQVVDLGAVGRGCHLQQLAREGFVQPGLQAAAMVVAPLASRVVPWQVTRSTGHQALPVIEFFLQGMAACVGLQLPCKSLDGAGASRQFHWATGQQLLVGRLQVLEQNPPRHAVHGQVMDDQQQALAALFQVDQQGTQQRALLKVQAGLHLIGQGVHVGEAGPLASQQGRLLPALTHRFDGAVGGFPSAGLFAERQAQGVMVSDHGLQRLLQQVGVQDFPGFEQHRLVPVLAFGNVAVEEHLVDRQQWHRAVHRTLIEAVLHFIAARDCCQGLHGLVLE